MEQPDMTQQDVATPSLPDTPVIEDRTRRDPSRLHDHSDKGLEARAVHAWFGKHHALADVSLHFPENTVTGLIGPSGCGKSTFLRLLNRMHEFIPNSAMAGDVLLDGQDIYGAKVNPADIRLKIGMVFQKPNPFPMSIFENVVYPLRIDGERNKRRLMDACERALREAALWDEVKDRLSENGLKLSGGQQQRLCIARAIVASPEILLLDEPCSALDPIATGKVEDLIERLKGEYSILIVTHNMQQASRISDYTAFLYLGHLLEYGSTSTIFTRPKLRETEDYITGRFL